MGQRVVNANLVSFCQGLICAVAIGVVVGPLAPAANKIRAQDLSPTSPAVKESVDRAIEFLSTSTHHLVGGQALVGLAILKATGEHDHPKVQEVLKNIVAVVQPGKKAGLDIYSLGLCILFLVNLDPEAQRKPIELLINELLSVQKPHGGWGYQAQATGDTSMTQYAVLALWEADRAGLSVPIPVWEKVANWLLRTQDPAGGFGYQGLDSGGGKLVPQSGVRHAMSAAGLGSLYLCQDHLGLRTRNVQKAKKTISSALKPIVKKEREAAKLQRLTNNIDPQQINTAEQLGEEWFRTNWSIEPQGTEVYLHYLLYALERYETFREAMGGSPEAQPWYQEGARLLIETQTTNGSWVGRTGAFTDTSFAVLFLIRSTMKTLMREPLLGAGSLIAGRGLPTDVRNVQVRNNKVVAEPLKGSADKLLTLMEDSDDPDSVRAAEGLFRLAEEADEATLNQHAVRLRKLADSPEPDARIAAVKALGRTRELDNVPTLIFALTDPDPDVVSAAVDALRYLSRQPPGSNGTVITDQLSRDSAALYWKNWYLLIRPDAIFDD